MSDPFCLNRKRCTLEYFRGNIIGSAADSFSSFIVMGEGSGQSKISNFKLQVLVEEEVAKFKISVDNFMSMDVVKSMKKLQNVIFYFHLCENFSSLQKFI